MRKPEVRICWFKNLEGRLESYNDFALDHRDRFFGKYPPHHGKVVKRIAPGRLVLGFLDYFPGTATQPGIPTTFHDMEVNPEFAVVFIGDNDYPIPDDLLDVAERLYSDPYLDPTIREFYRDCEARSAGIISPADADPRRATPSWDKEKRILTYRGIVCRAYRRESDRQFRLLDAFEGAG